MSQMRRRSSSALACSIVSFEGRPMSILAMSLGSASMPLVPLGACLSHRGTASNPDLSRCISEDAPQGISSCFWGADSGTPLFFGSILDISGLAFLVGLWGSFFVAASPMFAVSSETASFFRDGP